jgi:3-oxoacyl-[acyl-carrier-protein] synthase III
MIRSVIIATGCAIPETIVQNRAFENHQFFESDGSKMYKNSKGIIEKFREITGISERRYVLPDQNASDLAFIAARDALTSSNIDKETLDYIIVAHNFGDIMNNRTSIVPSLASRVKSLLGVKNPDCVAYDIAFGCPGWLEGVIQANYYIRSSDAKRCMVIGTETLSRVIDPHDRDSMIYSDGSGAVILEASTSDKGVLAHKTQTYAADHANLLRTDVSYSDFGTDKRDLFIKMNGRKVYEFGLNYVPMVIKAMLDKAKLKLLDITKILLHQANDKMDAAIVERLFKLYGISEIPKGIMPMTIGWLGNSSVATIPTLLDLITKGKLNGQQINPGDKVVMASLGAGMNINALVYQY